MKPGFIEKISSELNGMCGGNVNSDLWFCGIEWANWNVDATIQDNLFSDEYFFQYNGKKVKIPFVREKWAETNLTGHPFDNKIARVILSWKSKSENNRNRIDDQVISEYIKSKDGEEMDKQNRGLYRRCGDIFNLNLFPLHERNVRTFKEEHSKETGCLLKSEYYTKCIEHRFPVFRKLVTEKKPKIIVCIGKTYIDFFRLAFWGNDYCNIEKEVTDKIYDIEIIQLKNSSLKFSINKKAEEPTLIVLPFLSTRHNCLSKPNDLNEIGAYIRNNYPDLNLNLQTDCKQS